MSKSFAITNGAESVTVDQDHEGTAQVTVTSQSGEASIALSASDLRDLMVVLGTFAEPYPGAWNRLNRYEDLQED